MVSDVLRAPGQTPRTETVLDTAQLVQLGEVVTWTNSNSKLNAGFLIAIFMLVLIYYLLWKTTIGYEIRAVGLSPSAAEYGGISPAKKIVLAMAISGMLGALAGVERILGFDEAFGFNNCTASTRSNASIYLYYDCVSRLCRNGKATCCAWKTFW